MPELPEVETICRQLKKSLINKTIIQVDAPDPRIIKNISLPNLRKNLIKTKVINVIRRGKALIVSLSNKKFLILHLRISGWLMLANKPQEFMRVAFVFDSGPSLQFCDSRVLGRIELVDDFETVDLIREMGPEPLEISQDQFIALFKDKKTKIKPLLMDQKFIAGIGNIYAQEALFVSKIHPQRLANTLSNKELISLYQALINILNKAIECHGSSADTYRQVSGENGTYTKHHLVYQKGGQPCKICKTPLISQEIAGRGTCFCPVCQK